MRRRLGEVNGRNGAIEGRQINEKTLAVGGDSSAALSRACSLSILGFGKECVSRSPHVHPRAKAELLSLAGSLL